MKYGLPIAAFAVAVAVALHPAPARAALDPCTVVAVEMMDAVNSSDARAGDFFRFQTINAVTDGKKIAIPQRTEGYGIVSIAVPAGREGRAGTLVLEPRYFVLPGGVHLGVVLNHNTDPLQKSGATNAVPGYLGAIPLPGLSAGIMAFNYFHDGKNIVVPQGTVFTVFPSDDPQVERCQGHPSY